MTTYAVIDHATHNVLGEYAEASAAEALVQRLMEADASTKADLEIRAVEASAPDLSGTVAVA